MLKSNGDGSYNISRQSTITLGLAVLLLTAVVGVVSFAVAQGQILTSHVVDPNIHWSKTTLDEAYMPRPEIQNELRAIRVQLDRIERQLEPSR